MTKQKYLMWEVNGEVKIKLPTETISVKLTPQRQAQFYTMVYNWLHIDGHLHEPTDSDDKDQPIAIPIKKVV
jgi:hypothetical protein